VADENLRVCLYHIPQMSGVPITLSLIEGLLNSHPGTVVGLKDSFGNWDNTRSIIEAFPELRTYSASESLIPVNAATGGAGRISATANVNAAGIRRLIDAVGTGGEAACYPQVSAVRTVFEGLPLIPSVKPAVAQQLGAPGLARVRPPFVATGAAHSAKIDEGVSLAGPQKG
jgi:4-hydroxy-tetrahydrodipicolinate synthase